jgi:hypothetical protein
MKKLLVLIGLLSLLFASCETITKYDDSIPEEKTTRVVTYRIGDVVAYNGIPVNWKRSAVMFQLNYYQIPAGDTLLEFNVNAGLGSGRYLTGKGLQIKYNFQPQKEYWFYIGQRDRTYGVFIYAWDFGDKNAGSINKNNFIGFAPFLNIDKVTGDNTIYLD